MLIIIIKRRGLSVIKNSLCTLFIFIQIICPIYGQNKLLGKNKNSEKYNYNNVNLDWRISYPVLEEKNPFYFSSDLKVNKESHPYVDLENFISNEIPIPKDINCINEIELFIFKINANGKIEILESIGKIDSLVREKIKENILKTENHWTLPSKESDPQFRYFIFTFHSSSPYFQNCDNYENLNSKFLYTAFALNEVQLLLTKHLNVNNSNIILLRTLNHFSEMKKKKMILEVPEI